MLRGKRILETSCWPLLQLRPPRTRSPPSSSYHLSPISKIKSLPLFAIVTVEIDLTVCNNLTFLAFCVAMMENKWFLPRTYPACCSLLNVTVPVDFSEVSRSPNFILHSRSASLSAWPLKDTSLRSIVLDLVRKADRYGLAIPMLQGRCSANTGLMFANIAIDWRTEITPMKLICRGGLGCADRGTRAGIRFPRLREHPSPSHFSPNIVRLEVDPSLQISSQRSAFKTFPKYS